MYVKFHDERCKGKAIMQKKKISIHFIVTLSFNLLTTKSVGHMWSPCMKFHDDRCKEKAIMRHKSFSVFKCIVTLTFDLKINRIHPRLMGESLHEVS